MDTMTTTDATRREHSLIIQTTADELWRSITDPQRTQLYWYGALNRSAWTPGARWTSESADGELFLEGEILEVEPRRRLVHTMHVVHEPSAAAESPSILTWELTPIGDGCQLQVTHEQLGPATLAYIEGGWEHILAGLKTLLETGEPRKLGAASPM